MRADSPPLHWHQIRGRLLKAWIWYSSCVAVTHGCVTACIALAAAILGKQLGGVSSSVLFFAYAATALMGSTWMTRTAGLRLSVISSLILLCMYVAAFLVAAYAPDLAWPAAIIGGILGGVAAGWLWTAQGLFFSRISKYMVRANLRQQRQQRLELAEKKRAVSDSGSFVPPHRDQVRDNPTNLAVHHHHRHHHTRNNPNDKHTSDDWNGGQHGFAEMKLDKEKEASKLECSETPQMHAREKEIGEGEGEDASTFKDAEVNSQLSGIFGGIYVGAEVFTRIIVSVLFTYTGYGPSFGIFTTLAFFAAFCTFLLPVPPPIKPASVHPYSSDGPRDSELYGNNDKIDELKTNNNPTTTTTTTTTHKDPKNGDARHDQKDFGKAHNHHHVNGVGVGISSNNYLESFVEGSAEGRAKGQAACYYQLAAASSLIYRNPLIRYMSVYGILFGVALSFADLHLNTAVVAEELGVSAVGWLSSLIPISSVLSSYPLTYLGKTPNGKRSGLWVGACLFGIVGVIAFSATPSQLRSIGWGLAFMYVLLGAGRGVFEVSNKAAYVDFFPGEQAAPAFSTLHACSGLSFGIAFIVYEYIPQAAMGIIIFLVALISVASTRQAYVLWESDVAARRQNRKEHCEEPMGGSGVEIGDESVAERETGSSYDPENSRMGRIQMDHLGSHRKVVHV